MFNFRGIIFTIIAATLYGLMPIWVKLAYTTGLRAFDVSFYRFSMATAMLGTLMVFCNIKFRIERQQIGPLLWVTLGYSGASLSLYLSYYYVNAGVATSLHYIFPVLVMLIAFIKYHEKRELYKWIALVASIGGIYLIAEPWGSSFSLRGVGLALISALFMAVYVLLINHHQIKKMDSLVQAFYSCLTAAFNSLALLLVQGNWPPSFSIKGMYYSGLVSFFCTVLALILFIKGVQSVGSANASIISTLEPVVSLIAGIIILQDPLTSNTSFGCLLIIIAVILIAYIDQVKEKRKIDANVVDSSCVGECVNSSKKRSSY